MTDPVIGIAFRRGQVIPVAAIRDAVLVDETLPAVAISDAELVDDELAVVASIGDAELIEEIAPVGTLAASPSSLSFGDVAVDGSAVLEVVVTNTGDADVAVVDIDATGMFSIEDDYGGPLAPDESFTVTMTPAPTSTAHGGTPPGRRRSSPPSRQPPAWTPLWWPTRPRRPSACR